MSDNITLTHDGQVLSNWSPEALLARGVPQSAIDAAVLACRKTRVNTACKRRIYAVASPETQMNMATASAVISGKTTSDRSDTETATLAGVGAALGWVSAMRGAAGALVSDTDLDMADDENWPTCPEAVIAVADQF